MVEKVEFQYISCCSLSGKSLTKCWRKKYFNTSHVVVYLLEEIKKLPIRDISIHLML